MDTAFARLAASLIVLRLEFLRWLTGLVEDEVRKELNDAWRLGYREGKHVGYMEAVLDETTPDALSPYEEEK